MIAFFNRVRCVPVAILVVVAALFATGCTSIPQRELQAYRKAFDEARAQSENVLADHATARQLRSNLLVASSLQSPRPSTALSLSGRLGLAALGATETTLEKDISVRLQAWAVVGSYNEALAAVAAGAEAAEVEGVVHGFLGALEQFPIKEVASLAGSMAPYAGVVSELLGIVQKEVAARQFRQAVLQAEGPMKEFSGLLWKDAVLFRDYRVTLLDERFTEQEIQVFDRAERFRLVTTAHGWQPVAEVNGLVRRVNASRVLAAGIETFPPVPDAKDLTPATPAAPSQDGDLIELRSLADLIEQEAQAARGTAATLHAYHELMRQYGLLLIELRRTHVDLADAARRSHRRLPALGPLQQVIINVRVAYRIYIANH